MSVSYFTHNVNYRNDLNIKRLRKQIGIEAYAIHIMLLEVIAEQSELRFPLKDLDLLADEFDVSEEKIKGVISKQELYEIEDGFIYSLEIDDKLKYYKNFKERAKKGAAARWGSDAEALPEHSPSNAQAMPKQCPSNAQAMRKQCYKRRREERRRKEKRRKERRRDESIS